MSFFGSVWIGQVIAAPTSELSRRALAIAFATPSSPFRPFWSYRGLDSAVLTM